MTPKNVAIESPELVDRVSQEADQAGQTLSEFTKEALERELARRSFQRLKRSTELRRRGVAEEQIDESVETAIQDYRAEQRSR